MKKVDVSLHNTALYDGCVVKRVKDTLHLETEKNKATDIVRANAHTIFSQLKDEGEKAVIFTGGMSLAIYITVALVAYTYVDRLFMEDKNGVVTELTPHQ